jgi:hypothetical protein
MYRTLLVLAILVFSSIAHADENRDSANFWQPKCKSLLVSQSQDTVAGACIGIMLMLKSMGRNFNAPLKVCVPPDATIDQMLRVVTKSIDEHPEQMHRPFIVLAIVASQTAWPCEK